MATRFGWAGHTSPHDMRGKVIGVSGPNGLCDIAFRVIGQTALRAKVPAPGECTGRTLEHGVVTLEALVSRHRHNIPYRTLRSELEAGYLKVVELD
jgi:hypothetical protein